MNSVSSDSQYSTHKTMLLSDANRWLISPNRSGIGYGLDQAQIRRFNYPKVQMAVANEL